MPLYNMLLIVLLLMIIAAYPSWPYSSGWGYYPTGGLGSLLVLLIILRLFNLI
jgi:hypothetical protein